MTTSEMKIPLVALENILSNAWDWEIKGYFDDDCSKDHRFNDVIAVAEWLSTIHGTDYDWSEKLEDLEADVVNFHAEAEPVSS